MRMLSRKNVKSPLTKIHWVGTWNADVDFFTKIDFNTDTKIHSDKDTKVLIQKDTKIHFDKDTLVWNGVE